MCFNISNDKYYEDVIDTGYVNNSAFPYLLIITNLQEDEKRKNPCDQYLKDRCSTNTLSSSQQQQQQQTTKLLDFLFSSKFTNTAYFFILHM